MGMIDSHTVESLNEISFDAARIKGLETYLQIGKRMHTTNARNLAVETAIKGNADYILWIDDDMWIPPNTHILEKLLDHDKDIVAPLFFVRRPPYMPLLFKRKVMADGMYTTFNNIMDYEPGLHQVDGIGFGVVLTKVDVFRRLEPPYFVMSDTFGEDLFFCNKAINANFKIYCDTTIKVGHIGDPPIIQEGNYLDNRQGADFWLAQKKDKDLKKVFNLTKKADIIMPCYHEFEKTKTAIESILTFTKDIDYRLIIINDGNDKEIKKYVNTISKHRKNIVYIANKENVGWVKAINQGIAFSEAPYVVFLNNDIEILPNMKHWLLRLVSGCMPEGIGATGPTSNFVMGIQNITYTEKVNVAEHFARFLIGFCMCVKREAIEKVGVLDEIFGIGGNDDLDYSIRLKKAGYKLKVLRDVFIQHEGNVSLNKAFGGPKGTVKEDKRTRKILVKKWGKAEVDRLFWFEEIKQATKFLMTGID